MRDLKLRVNGRDYAGWKSIRVTRGIEAMCGSFDLSVSERWAGQDKPWPIREEDECAILIGDVQVITGYLDKRSAAYGSTDHTLSVGGRDKTSALVDCSADIGAWGFVNISLGDVARRLCEPFGISVLTQGGVGDKVLDRFTIDPGETCFEALDKACRMAGVLPISDSGDLRLTRAGSSRTKTDLVEGKNILSASLDCQAAGRFRTYRVLGQQKGTDAVSGAKSASTKGTAKDDGVRREERSLIVRADTGSTDVQAKVRAQWEAKVRAARAQTVSAKVRGWTQEDGELWPVNALVHIESPMLGLDTDVLISEVTYSLDESGTLTQLALKRPDAFIPEPVVLKPPSKKKSVSPWAEDKLFRGPQ
jgi:prophage tail gpP-like protein